MKILCITQADFEVYDERALDSQNTVLDIYLGVSSIK
jgi:predicted transcriptional regulator YdeE